MHCTNCGTKADRHHLFCAKCGEAFNKHANRPQRQRQPRPQYVPALKTEQGSQRYNEIVSSMEQRTKSIRRILWICALIGVSVGIMITTVTPQDTQGFGSAALFGGMLLAVVALFCRHGLMSKDQYYSIPGSQDDRGHRCIACGHHGIYRKGEYKSNIVTAQCSKCEFPFWNESK